MTLMQRLAAGAAWTALACAASSAYAQEITGALAGTVLDGAGHPVSGAQVKVTNVSTGQTLNASTTQDGFFTIRNLPVGGPYNVVVNAGANGSKSVQIPQIEIGAPFQLTVNLPAAGTVEELVVTAARPAAAAMLQTGPRSTFTPEDIAATPSFARDLKDLVAQNPLVTIDPSNQGALLVAGTNNHVNTIYVDGVRQSDDFGLNASGYPTQRSPYALDIVQAFNFEVAPYDVRYGNFQGGILNIVTKSGTNTFHGGAFFEQDSNRIAGRKIGSDAVKLPNATDRKISTIFKDQNYGFNIGGPIWKDHLFGFFDYEKYKGVGSSGGFVPSDVQGANPIAGVTSAVANQVQGILKNGYNYDPLNYGGSGPVVDEKYFGRIDWLITDNQHLFVTYQQTKGSTYNVPNGSATNRILNFASNDYIYEQDLTAFTADLVSHWTRNLTTELEYTRKKVQSPSTLLTGPFAEFMIGLPTTSSIYLGPDVSRQANDLLNVDKQVRARADYTWNDHVITAGVEHEQAKLFDLFVQNATGAYTFNSSCGLGDTLLNLQAHIACRFVYQNAFDNKPSSAGGTITNKTDVAFLQDEWRVTRSFTLRAGLRYEHFGVDDVPRLNQRFQNQYGFANTATVDGKSILLPRFGFNWQPDRSLLVSGGFGLFSGGNPAVYTYNSFQNSGNILGTRTYTCSVMGATACPVQLLNVTGSSIPQNVQTDITNSANLGTGNVNALDPRYKIPSTWKATLSVVKTFDFSDYGFMGRAGQWLGDGWRVHGDAFYSKVKNNVLFQDIWGLQYQIANAPDGRPVFDPARYTNALNRTSGTDILLTNSKKGTGKVFAVGFGKSWDWGLSFDYTYTHQNVKETSSATSSVATSNYFNQITSDPNHPDYGPSDYQIKWENKIALNYQHKFFGDNKTTITLVGFNRAGLPFSYAFCAETSSSCTSAPFTGTYDTLTGQSATSTNHQLLYIPKGDGSGVVTATSDPIVKFAPGFDLAGFNAFLQSRGLTGLEGQIAPRNKFRSRDVASFNLHFGQEFPAFFPTRAKGEVYFDVINVGNLINKHWGVINQAGFPYVLTPVTARNCQIATGTGTGPTQCIAGKGNYYQFDTFRGQAGLTTNVVTPTSPPVPTWVLKLGIRYKF